MLAKTPKRTQANYVFGQIVFGSIGEVGEKVQKITRKFYSLLSGTNIVRLRWKKCIYDVTNNLALTVSALYIRNYFNDNEKQNVQEIIENIKISFKNILKEVYIFFMFYSQKKFRYDWFFFFFR